MSVFAFNLKIKKERNTAIEDQEEAIQLTKDITTRKLLEDLLQMKPISGIMALILMAL